MGRNNDEAFPTPQRTREPTSLTVWRRAGANGVALADIQWPPSVEADGC